jgi:hypothetical protein
MASSVTVVSTLKKKKYFFSAADLSNFDAVFVSQPEESFSSLKLDIWTWTFGYLRSKAKASDVHSGINDARRSVFRRSCLTSVADDTQ